MVTSIERRYIKNHPKCAGLYSTSKTLFPNGVTHDTRNMQPFPYFVSHASGGRKWDVDGQEIIDYRGGHGALILGHNHPEIVNAVSNQLSMGTHYAASTELEVRWAQRVIDLIPCAEKVRFNSSGTEATLMALRMARAHTGRTKIIKFDHHFHGWHDYVRAYESGAGGIPEEVQRTVLSFPPNNISLVESAVRETDVAAVIIEPTGAHMGQHPIRPQFLGELRQVCDEHNVVLIFDEVVTGFRISRGGAQGYYGVIPDLCSLAKILGGGLPAGAVAGKTELIDMIQLSNQPEFNDKSRVGHYGTFNANPLSASAGAKALELLTNEPINERADSAAERLKKGLNDVLSDLEIPGCASGVASIVMLRLGVEHDCDNELCFLGSDDQRTVDNEDRKHQLELALYSHGVDGGPRFLVGAAHTGVDVDETIDAVEKALVDIRAVGLV